MREITVLLCFLIIASVSSKEISYNVLDFGAIADGETLNTKAIQKAIDECSNNGGGTVETYLTGARSFQDNVILNLQAGSKILASKNYEDYLIKSNSLANSNQKDISGAFIVGNNKKNIRITGFEIIDF